MKLSAFFIAFLWLIHLCQSQTWSWSEESPVAGKDLVVTVKGIEIEEDLHIVGYYFLGKDLTASDINYIVEDGNIKMTLRVPETNWMRLVIKDGENDPVAGDHRDVVMTGAPVRSSVMDFANATAAYYRVLGLTRNEAELAALYREAIQVNPSWLDNPMVLRSYYNMARAAKSDTDLARIQEYLAMCEAKADPISQDVLISAIRISKETGDTVLYKSLRKKLDQSYPSSIISQEEQLALFRKANSIADKILLREKYMQAYPPDEANRWIHDQMTSEMIKECAQKEEWQKLKEYIGELIDPSTKASACNNYAWTLAGSGLEEEASQLGLAAELSSQSLILLDPKSKKPASMSQSEWERSLEFSKAMYGDTYALILFKQRKVDEALAMQLDVLKAYKYGDPEMNERYAIYLEKAGEKDELLSFIEERIKEGQSSPRMKAMHQAVWTTEKTQEQLYDRYLAQLEAIAKMKRLEEIKGMWMEDSSVPFTLKDLDGKTVSLADFKGKTVVLDFWATWCGPCKASFPGMKNAVEYYAGDENVVFLFIDTWERGSGIEEKVQKFIADNQYPFHVLMDIENAVVGLYKVEGIPTKFIVGPDQKIRFKSVGYGGNTEQLTEELITMIEMARQEAVRP